MNNSLVSICIPIYNGEMYIKNTIQSVLDQTYKFFELILVDDNSNDNTEKIIREFKDKRIKYYKNINNMGMVANWNEAVSHANGKYVKLLCQDDLLERTCVEKEVEILDENDYVQLVSCASYIINERNEILLKRRLFRKNHEIKGNAAMMRSIFLAKNFFGEPTLVLYRKDVLNKIGNYDSEFWYLPDWDFNMRCLKFGSFYYINEFLASFRVSSASQTNEIIRNNREKLKKEEIKFLKKYEIVSNTKLGRFDKFNYFFRTKVRNILKYIFLNFYVKKK